MEEHFIGQIELFPFAVTPGWLPCDGRILEIKAFNPLYVLISTKFGGDGVSTFALPDLREASPIANMVYCIAFNGVYPIHK